MKNKTTYCQVRLTPKASDVVKEVQDASQKVGVRMTKPDAISFILESLSDAEIKRLTSESRLMRHQDIITQSIIKDSPVNKKDIDRLYDDSFDI